MKILLVTGKLAAPIIKEVVKNLPSHIIADIKVLNYPVAALMSVRYILENLKNDENISKYDWIVLPGLVYGDASEIENSLKVKVVKGTEEAYDLPLVIDALIKGVELSKTDPADKIIKKNLIQDISKILNEIEKNGIYAFEMEGVKIPIRPPPFRIFLEVDYRLNEEQIMVEAKRVKKWVDVLVISFPVGYNGNYDEIRKRVKIIRDLGLPVGIDAESPKQLIEGVRAGASFVFNLNEENINLLESIKKDAAFIVAPISPMEKAKVTIEIIKRARDMGFDKIIADPILSPPLHGLTQSLLDYIHVKSEFREIPMLMGLLNVTELMDADSVGINALLTVLAGEIGVGNLLTMEKGKTRWSSWEIRKASIMTSLAISQKKFPKDLGIDLLLIKDKKKKIFNLEDNDKIEEIKDYIQPNLDKKGFIKIFRTEDKIVIKWLGKEKLTLVGRDALSLGRALIRKIDNFDPEHALYLGYELSKAEIALVLDKTYVQDKPLFRGREPDDTGNTNNYNR